MLTLIYRPFTQDLRITSCRLNWNRIWSGLKPDYCLFSSTAWPEYCELPRHQQMLHPVNWPLARRSIHHSSCRHDGNVGGGKWGWTERVCVLLFVDCTDHTALAVCLLMNEVMGSVGVLWLLQLFVDAIVPPAPHWFQSMKLNHGADFRLWQACGIHQTCICRALLEVWGSPEEEAAAATTPNPTLNPTWVQGHRPSAHRANTRTPVSQGRKQTALPKTHPSLPGTLPLMHRKRLQPNPLLLLIELSLCAFPWGGGSTHFAPWHLPPQTPPNPPFVLNN